MKIAHKKKPKEIEKEIKAKIIQSIDSILSKDSTLSEKLKKLIRKSASEISKKYIKAIKKEEKKTGKIKPASPKRTVAKKAKVKKAAPQKTTKSTPINGKALAKDVS